MKRILKIAIALSLSALALAGTSTPSPAAERDKKVVMIVMNAVRLEEILAAPTPNIDRLMSAGATGLMNARAMGGDNTGNFYISIGAGARAASGPRGSFGFNALERLPENYYLGLLTSSDVVRQNNRLKAPDGSVVNLSINDAAAKNVKYHNNIVPGLLGEALGRGGKKTAAVGNADSLGVTHREITLITMNMRGLTDGGDVSGDMAAIDKTFPGGLRTNYRELADTVVEAARRADFVAVELGDTARAAAQRTLMNQSVNAAVRKRGIVAADRFLGVLEKKLAGGQSLIILAAPEPQAEALLDRDYLTPVFISGLGQGALTSNTTKKNGLVGNMDIAPTILNFLGVPIPVEMAGSPIKSSKMSDVANRLVQRHDQIVAMRTVRSPVLLVYSLLILGGLAGAIAVVRLRTIGRPLGNGYIWALKTFLLFLLSVPLASLIQIPVAGDNLPIAVGSLVAGALIIALIALALSFKNPLMPFIAVGAGTSLVLAYDTLTGTFLSERSFFGSDLIAGGRFYGLGNTYMGIMIGASVLGLASVCSRAPLKNSRMTPFVGSASLLAVAVIVGHPRIGANVGGLITGVSTALFFWVILKGAAFNWKTLGAGLAILIVLMAVILSLDLPQENGKSHAGKAIAVIQAKGSQAVGDIVIRKLRMNIRGIFSFPGLLVLALAGVIVMLRWALVTDSSLGSLRPDYDTLIKGFKTSIWAAAVAGTFNDTGAIAAAAILIFLAVPLYLLALDPANLA